MARRLPSLLLALSTLALAACATTPDPAPLADASARADRVVVAPLNLAIRAPAELEGDGDPVWQELLRHFQDRDRQVAVISPITAERMWLEVMLDEEEPGLEIGFEAATARFARALAEHRDFDILVMPSLVLRKARVNGQSAYWDGARRAMPMESPAWDAGLSEVLNNGATGWVNGVRGDVAAASLHVQVLGPDGVVVHEGIGGLDVVQRAEIARPWTPNRWKFVERPQPFADSGSVREGVESALERSVRRTAWAW